MVQENSIEECIVRNIGDENVVFVFPTEVSCKGWADWTVEHSGLTGVSAVSMDRFIAWDKFKGDCIRTQQEDKETVPSLMRKIFASYLIEKNAKINKSNIEKNQDEPLLFKSLITKEFADSASAFSDWIAKILPSLKIWKTYHDTQAYKSIIDDMKKQALMSGKDFSLSENDAEDEDFQTLFDEYKHFLDENNLFDPAWEQPPFKSVDDKTRYVIVYPQILEDWTQYEFLLKMAEQEKALSFVNVPLDAVPKNPAWCHFDTSVEELHNVASFLRKMHDQEKIAWTDMAVSVPNMDTYGSYLERELNLFEIPNVTRFSKMLSEHGSGKIFSQIQECVRTDFSFESVKSLLLNDDIPWKNKYLLDKFIVFGKENNCVCSYFDESEKARVDIWEKSFDDPVRRLGDEKIPERKEKLDETISELRKFYGYLRASCKKMVAARSFKSLLRAYRTFRKLFIDRRGFKDMKQSDLILSRCITELTGLVELEAKYCLEAEKGSGLREDGKTAYKISNVFGFFVSHLEQTQYLDQTEKRGVQVYPYRAAAASPFKVHVVVDASQDSLSVGSLFKQLDFLNEAKRDVILKIDPSTNDKFFKFSDFDPSESFISLYQLSSEKASYFTSAEHSVEKYGFPHGFLKKEDRIEPEKSGNIFSSERFSFVEKTAEYPAVIMKSQKVGFDSWKERVLASEKEMGLSRWDESKEKVREIIEKKYRSKAGGKFKISPSNVKAFYKCPRQWLFERILSLKPLNNEADLMNDFVVGRINHAVFEEYLGVLKSRGLSFFETLEKITDESGALVGYGGLLDEFKDILADCIEKANSRFTEPDEYEDFGETLSEMTKTIVNSQKSELFVKLLPSVEAFSRFFPTAKIHRLEAQYTFHPKDDDGRDKDFYFDGRVDCILKNESADESMTEFYIIDFKSGMIPSPILYDPEKADEIPDFQMPIYKKIFSANEKFKNGSAIEPSGYFFFSIKDMKLNGKTSVKSAALDKGEFDATCKKCDELIEAFVERLNKLDFSIDERVQKKNMCANKDLGANCKDYQSVCRRFFTVSGE